MDGVSPQLIRAQIFSDFILYQFSLVVPQIGDRMVMDYGTAMVTVFSVSPLTFSSPIKSVIVFEKWYYTILVFSEEPISNRTHLPPGMIASLLCNRATFLSPNSTVGGRIRAKITRKAGLQ